MASPREIARQQYAEAQAWYKDALTEAQAATAGVGPQMGGWPPPCDRCGALYRLTPKGRWLIDHFPEGHSEPRIETRLRVVQ